MRPDATVESDHAYPDRIGSTQSHALVVSAPLASGTTQRLALAVRDRGPLGLSDQDHVVHPHAERLRQLPDGFAHLFHGVLRRHGRRAELGWHFESEHLWRTLCIRCGPRGVTMGLPERA